MELSLAERLAGSLDPKGLTSLQNRNNDPAVAHAVAEQFGAYLMQNLMQNADGQAIPMVEGTGGTAVSAMFATAMSRVAMSGDKLGLADMIYQSMGVKDSADGTKSVGDGAADTVTTAAAAAGTGSGPAATGSAPAATGSAPSMPAVSAHPQHSYSLSPYRQGNGARPPSPPPGKFTLPPIPNAVAGPASGTAAKAKPMAAAAPIAAAASAAPATAAAPVAAAVAPAASALGAPDAGAHRAPAWKVVNVPRFGAVMMPDDATTPAPAAVPAPTAGAQAATAPPSGPGAAVAAAAASAARPAPPPHTLPMSSAPRNYGLPWTHASGTTTPATPSGGTAAAGVSSRDAQAFAQQLGPSLQEAADKLGVSPRILMAQAALETGWGHSVVGNNIFGIKANSAWHGASVTAHTHEMVNGHLVARDASFRAYPSVASAVEDYVTLLSASGRYKAALNTGDNVAAFAHAIDAGGYATGTGYAGKLTAIANSPAMGYATAMLEHAAPGQLASAHS